MDKIHDGAFLPGQPHGGGALGAPFLNPRLATSSTARSINTISPVSVGWAQYSAIWRVSGLQSWLSFMREMVTRLELQTQTVYVYLPHYRRLPGNRHFHLPVVFLLLAIPTSMWDRRHHPSSSSIPCLTRLCPIAPIICISLATKSSHLLFGLPAFYFLASPILLPFFPYNLVLFASHDKPVPTP